MFEKLHRKMFFQLQMIYSVTVKQTGHRQLHQMSYSLSLTQLLQIRTGNQTKAEKTLTGRKSCDKISPYPYLHPKGLITKPTRTSQQ